MWWGDAAHDQRGTDAFSLVSTTARRSRGSSRDSRSAACRALEVPEQPRANWFVKLSDVAPDGMAGDAGRGRRIQRHNIACRLALPLDVTCPASRSELTIDPHLTSLGVLPKATASASIEQRPVADVMAHAVPDEARTCGSARTRNENHAARRAARFASPGACVLAARGKSRADRLLKRSAAGTSSGLRRSSESVGRNPQTGDAAVA